MVEISCPLCGEVCESTGHAHCDSAIIVECPLCGHVFDVEMAHVQVERFNG